MKLLHGQFRVLPVAHALAASGDPDFSDKALLESNVLFRVHDLDVEIREWGSAADNLLGRSDFGDLGRQTGLPQRQSTLVDGDNIAATERNRQGVLDQPVSGIKALRLEPVRLKCLKKSCVSVRLYRFRCDH